MHTHASVLHLQTGKENGSFSAAKESCRMFESKTKIARAEKSLLHSLLLAFIISGYKGKKKFLFVLMCQICLQTFNIFCKWRSRVRLYYLGPFKIFSVFSTTSNLIYDQIATIVGLCYYIINNLVWHLHGFYSPVHSNINLVWHVVKLNELSHAFLYIEFSCMCLGDKINRSFFIR